MPFLPKHQCHFSRTRINNTKFHNGTMKDPNNQRNIEEEVGDIRLPGI